MFSRSLRSYELRFFLVALPSTSLRPFPRHQSKSSTPSNFCPPFFPNFNVQAPNSIFPPNAGTCPSLRWRNSVASLMTIDRVLLRFSLSTTPPLRNRTPLRDRLVRALHDDSIPSCRLFFAPLLLKFALRRDPPPRVPLFFSPHLRKPPPPNLKKMDRLPPY